MVIPARKTPYYVDRQIVIGSNRRINGNTMNLLCRDIKGQVGDDLVALNACDWQDSSVDSDLVRGVFAALGIGADIGCVSFENIDLQIDCEKFPLACLVSVGPKSVVSG